MLFRSMAGIRVAPNYNGVATTIVRDLMWNAARRGICIGNYNRAVWAELTATLPTAFPVEYNSARPAAAGDACARRRIAACVCVLTASSPPNMLRTAAHAATIPSACRARRRLAPQPQQPARRRGQPDVCQHGAIRAREPGPVRPGAEPVTVPQPLSVTFPVAFPVAFSVA